MKLKEMETKDVYQFVVLGALVAFNIMHFAATKSFSGEITGAIIAVCVGIGISKS